MAASAKFVHDQIFIGLMLNVLLFGINVTQTYIYYIHSKKDRLWVKIWVVVIFVADFIQPLLCFLYLYWTPIVHFAEDVPQLLTANPVFAVVPTMTGVTATIVQCFFARRILILTNNWYYVAFVVATAITGGVCTIVVAYERGLSPQFVNLSVLKSMVIVGCVSDMLADIMITSILVWFLHKHKSGLRPSDEMVGRIIRVTIQTGLLTLIFAILALIFYLIDSDGGTYLLLNLIVSKLSTTSLLSSLNSRQGWGYDVSEWNEDHLSIDLGLRFSSSSTSDRTSVLEGPPLDSRTVELGL